MSERTTIDMIMVEPMKPTRMVTFIFRQPAGCHTCCSYILEV